MYTFITPDKFISKNCCFYQPLCPLPEHTSLFSYFSQLEGFHLSLADGLTADQSIVSVFQDVAPSKLSLVLFLFTISPVFTSCLLHSRDTCPSNLSGKLLLDCSGAYGVFFSSCLASQIYSSSSFSLTNWLLR